MSLMERVRRLQQQAERHANNNPYSAAPLIAELAKIVEEMLVTEAACAQVQPRQVQEQNCKGGGEAESAQP